MSSATTTRTDRPLGMDEIVQIAQQAVLDAQEANRRAGVPNVYGIDGRVHYEWPDGRVLPTPPPNWKGPVPIADAAAVAGGRQ